MKQIVRLIGGRFRGKKIHFPALEGLRPTPDRVRETLFNWLMHSVLDARCLDAFAGSGALGLEAYSRGAAEVYFIEQHRAAANQLQTLMTEFNTPQLRVFNTNAIDFLQHTQRTFDLIFLDPPYDSHLLIDCLDIIHQSNCLALDGLVYVESSQSLNPNLRQWEIYKQKQAGQVNYGLLKLKKH